MNSCSQERIYIRLREKQQQQHRRDISSSNMGTTAFLNLFQDLVLILESCENEQSKHKNEDAPIFSIPT